VTALTERHWLDLASHERFPAFVEAAEWTFAKTMPRIPHWYTVRGRTAPPDEQWFTWAVAYLQEVGEPRRFGRRVFRYVILDGWRYWTMGYPPRETTIINRAVEG